MKSPSLAKLLVCVGLLVASCALLPIVAPPSVPGRALSVQQTKPPERCAPRQLYAAPEQPECYRNLP